MSNTIEIKVPDIGDAKDVEVIEVMVAVGDTIQAEQSLITLESDKSSMEIPASQGGVVKSISVKIGDKVSEGAVILVVEASASGEAKAADAGAGQAPAGSTQDVPADTPEKQEADGPAEGGQAESRSDAAQAGQSAGSQKITVEVPDIGDASDVSVIEVMVAEGDEIKAEQSLVTLETDKASMEIPSTHAGRVTAVKVKVGDKVSKGSAVIELETAGSASQGESPTKPATQAQAANARNGESAPEALNGAKPAAAAASAGASPSSASSGSAGDASRPAPAQALQDENLAPNQLPHASPSVRKFARELGANLSKIKGSGPKDRITADDVRAFVKQALASQGQAAPAAGAAVSGGTGLNVLAWPTVDFTKFGEVESKPLSRIKKISGANLHRNWVMIPHVTNNDVADITDLEALRVSLNKENEKSGVKVTMLAFLIKAVVAEKIPGIQCVARWRQSGLQALLPRRVCGRYA